MRKILFFVSPIITAIGVYLILITFVFKSTATGGLQVTATPQATVYLDGKEIGKTPLCRCEGSQMITVGNYTVRLVPSDGSDPYEEKIPVNPNVITVVDRTFGSVDKVKGSVITLTKSSSPKAALSVISFPLGATLSLDGSNQGLTPLTLNDVTPSDHEIILSKEGYSPTTLRIHAVTGYTLTATITLPIDLTIPVASITPAPSASPSAAPTTTASASVTILSTPTGFLRVRDQPSISGKEVGQVHPGEVYPYTDQQNGWTKITLKDGTVGWVSSQYVKTPTP